MSTASRKLEPSLEMNEGRDHEVSDQSSLRINQSKSDQEKKLLVVKEKMRRWTVEESVELYMAVNEYEDRNIDWKYVTARVNNITKTKFSIMQCQSRWRSTLRKHLLTQDPWSGNEDKLLQELVEKYGEKCNWHKVSQRLVGRDAVQCLDRYLNIQKSRTELPSEEGMSLRNRKQIKFMPSDDLDEDIITAANILLLMVSSLKEPY